MLWAKEDLYLEKVVKATELYWSAQDQKPMSHSAPILLVVLLFAGASLETEMPVSYVKVRYQHYYVHIYTYIGR